MQQQQELQDQINRILLLIHGSAELSTSAHQWDSLHLDILSFDHQEGVLLPEEEVVADSQEEATQEEEVVVSQVEEILEVSHKEILKEDLKETD